MTIGPDAEAYYLGIVAEGVEGPGRWTGRGAQELGLAGAVGMEPLSAVLDGRHPDRGIPLHVRPVKVRGVELTFQVPKSVSVLWAVAGPEVADQVDAGRRAALDATLAYIEEEALVLGATGEPAGMVGAAFAHRTSRAGDPHLHAHVIVANLGNTGSGRWMAVNRLALDKHLHAAGFMFEAHLRHELSQRLGVRFGAVRAGIAQVEGVPESVCRRFSQRRLQVEAVMAAHGGSSAAAARLAALIDRPARHPGLAAEVLAPEWETRARAAGFDRDAARRLMGRAVSQEPQRAPHPDALGLSAMSSFSRRDVLEAVCASRSEGIAADQARRAVDEVLGSTGVVPLPGHPVLRRRDVVRTAQGHMVVVGTDRARWTTRSDLAARDRAAALATEASGRGRVSVDPSAVDAFLGGTTGLTPPERSVVAGLVRSPDGVRLLAAPAGPEGERVLAACRRLWSDEGARVLGAAPDDPAAARLGAATGIDAERLDRVTARLAPLAAPAVAPTVLVVAGGQELAAADVVRLLETAGRTRIDVVLVGDMVRLPEIDRGGTWRAMSDAVGGWSLERRARDRGREQERLPGRERTARPELVAARATGPERDGRANLEPVFRVGERLSLSPSPHAVRSALVRDWRSAWDAGQAGGPSGGPAVMMVAAGRADVDDLNARARELLDGDGTLVGQVVPLGGLEVRGGDAVVVAAADRTARQEGWCPGQTWRVLPGGAGLSGGDGMVRDAASVPGLSFRWGYAATPYQARQAGAREWLVLGAPPTISRGPEEPLARHYVVAAVEDGDRLAATLARRESSSHQVRLRGHGAVLDPPAYLVAALGPPPGDAEARRTWRAAAGSVEAYRERWGIDDRHDPLGPERPLAAGRSEGSDRAVLQRAERREVARQLSSAALALGRARGPQRDLGRGVSLSRPG